MRAVGDVPWPAARLAAVDKAGLDAYDSLHLTRDDFAHPLDLGALKVAISAGAKAVAVWDQLDPTVVAGLLTPFARQGVAAAQEVLDASVTPR